MSRATHNEVQLGIDFLSQLKLTDAQLRALPDVPDYQALASLAQVDGLTLSAPAAQEAFRLLMQARVVVARLPE